MNSDSLKLFHPLNATAPQDMRLNNPFYYKPDDLTMAAVSELQKHLPQKPREGKMWGVLVVELNGNIGFINAYSGQIGEKMLSEIGKEWAGCPAIFDYLQPDGYFKQHENEITALNRQIEFLESDSKFLHLKKELADLRQKANDKIEEKRAVMLEAKAKRHERRRSGVVTDGESVEMECESKFLKAELHRAKQHYRKLLHAKEEEIGGDVQKINSLKRRRSLMSDHLQAWLFSQFVLLNGNGERKALPQIFTEYYERNNIHGRRVCPSGAGECCEPKLLHYAFFHGMRPIRMASFWWGPSLGNEVRRHGQFYPACSGRCKPILEWMLKGLKVMSNPLEEQNHQTLKIIYDDEYLAVVNKPEGMLAVPGKSGRESVISILTERWRGKSEALPVHRLDMATSGLMIVAKDADTQRKLRCEFENRSVSKEYEAIVEGIVKVSSGTIRLPIMADPMDRPRQRVDMERGKESVTFFQVLSVDNGETRLRLIPHTGRTHQLRVHCASPLGLDAPIKGDMLYGKSAGRLYLQARRLAFTHPATGRKMSFTLPPDF